MPRTLAPRSPASVAVGMPPLVRSDGETTDSPDGPPDSWPGRADVVAWPADPLPLVASLGEEPPAAIAAMAAQRSACDSVAAGGDAGAGVVADAEPEAATAAAAGGCGAAALVVMSKFCAISKSAAAAEGPECTVGALWLSRLLLLLMLLLPAPSPSTPTWVLKRTLRRAEAERPPGLSALRLLLLPLPLVPLPLLPLPVPLEPPALLLPSAKGLKGGTLLLPLPTSLPMLRPLALATAEREPCKPRWPLPSLSAAGALAGDSSAR